MHSLWVTYFWVCRDRSFPAVPSTLWIYTGEELPFCWVTPLVVLASSWLASLFFFILFLAAPQLHCPCSPAGIVLYASCSFTPPLLLYLFCEPHPASSERDMSRASFCEHTNTPLVTQGGPWGPVFSSISVSRWGRSGVWVCVRWLSDME